MVQDLLSYLIQKAAPCQRGPLFCEERSLSAEADSQTTDIRRQMTGVRLCFLSFRVERNEIEKSPRATQPAAIVRKGHPATLLSDSLKSPRISNPPLVLRTTFPPQAGGTIKVPQTSILPALCILPLLPGKAFATLSVCHLSSVIDLIVKNVFENKCFPRAFPSIMSCISCIFFRNLPAEEGAN